MLPSNYAGAPVFLADYVNKMDREHILKEIRSRMYSRSVLIKVVDVTNFEGSQI